MKNGLIPMKNDASPENSDRTKETDDRLKNKAWWERCPWECDFVSLEDTYVINLLELERSN
jgi:hypothetical protein